MTALCLIVSIIASYLFGSVNFAIIVTKICIGRDIREFGSGNAGMTNVLRTVGKKAAVWVTLGDVSKGLLAVLGTRLLLCVATGGTSLVFEYLAACAALLGHLFPVFYKFKGGKGILVSTGALLALSPWAILIAFGMFLIVTFSTRIVSLGSITAAVVFPIATTVIRTIEQSPTRNVEMLFSIAIGVAIIVMHRANIGRLLRGEENKFARKKDKQGE